MDQIKYNKSKGVVEGKFDIFMYRDGDTVYAIIASLDLCGYGSNKEEAFKELKKAYHTFCASMINDPQYDLIKYLKSVGFRRDNYFKKKYVSETVDTKELSGQFHDPHLLETQQQVAL